MTPKEKAIELRQEFVFRIEDFIQPKTWDEVESLNTKIYNAAKECAELAVDEILTWLKAHQYSTKNYDAFVFYNEVKQEIEAL
jgi:hypothetical protein